MLTTSCEPWGPAPGQAMPMTYSFFLIQREQLSTLIIRTLIIKGDESLNNIFLRFIWRASWRESVNIKYLLMPFNFITNKWRLLITYQMVVTEISFEFF